MEYKLKFENGRSCEIYCESDGQPLQDKINAAEKRFGSTVKTINGKEVKEHGLGGFLIGAIIGGFAGNAVATQGLKKTVKTVAKKTTDVAKKASNVAKKAVDSVKKKEPVKSKRSNYVPNRLIDSIETKSGKKIDNKDIIDGAHTKSKVNVSKKRVDATPKNIDKSKKLSMQTDYLSAREIKVVNTTYGRKLKGSEIIDGAYVKKGVFADGGALDKFNWKSFTIVELISILPDDVKLAYLSTPDKKYISYSDVKEIKPFLKTKWTISDYGDIRLMKGEENLYLDIIVYDLVSKSEKENTISVYTKENHQGLKDLAASLVKKFENGGKTDEFENTTFWVSKNKKGGEIVSYQVMRGDFMTKHIFESYEEAASKARELNSKLKFEEGGKTPESDKFNYMMLSRLQSDCDYYLGFGNRNPKVLWAGNEEDHIAEMKKIYNELPEKPEWLTMEQIEDYESKMKSDDTAYAKGGLTEHGLEIGDKLYDTFAPYVFPNEVIVIDKNNKKHFVNLDEGTRGKSFAKGGVVGQEVVFNHWSGDVKTGTIEELHSNGEYIVQSGFGSMLVNPDDVISISEPKPEKKFLGIFEDGGSIENQIDILKGSIVEFHYMGVAKPDSAKIISAYQSSPQFRYRDLFLKFEGDTLTQIPSDKVDQFLSGKMTIVKDSKGDAYGIKLTTEKMEEGGVIKSALLTDEENALTNQILAHPLFKDYKELETFSSGGNNFHTCILLSNGHIVTINYDSGVIQYSYLTYDSIGEYLEESSYGLRGWDNESYTPKAEMNMIYIEDGYNEFFDSKLTK